MSYTIEVMSIRTGSDNRYTIEPFFGLSIGSVLIDGVEANKIDHIAKKTGMFCRMR